MALFSRATWVSRHQNGKPFWILMKQNMTVAVTSAVPYANHLRITTDRLPCLHCFLLAVLSSFIYATLRYSVVYIEWMTIALILLTGRLSGV